MPGQLDVQNNRKKRNALGGKQRMDRLENSFLWLQDAGVTLPCHNVSAPVTPLRLNEIRSLFKLHMLDSGLLCAASPGSLQYDLVSGETGINCGSILENAFVQSTASLDLDLFYCNSKKTGELDFAIQNGKDMDVFEVKSGSSWTSHKAIDYALGDSGWSFGQADVLCKGNVAVDGPLVYLPLYMIMFYQPPRTEHAALAFNLSVLQPPRL